MIAGGLSVLAAGRWGADETAKYINSPQSAIFDKSRLLYGLNLGKSAIRERGTAVIVEGYMDVIQAHQAGYANVVAQMGTAMTEPQIAILARLKAKKIVLALDADTSGQSATSRSPERILDSLLNKERDTFSTKYNRRLDADIRVFQLPRGKDPDDLLRHSPEAWPALVENATELVDFIVTWEMKKLPSAPSLREKLAVAEAGVAIPTNLGAKNLPRRKRAEAGASAAHKRARYVGLDPGAEPSRWQARTTGGGVLSRWSRHRNTGITNTLSSRLMPLTLPKQPLLTQVSRRGRSSAPLKLIA